MESMGMCKDSEVDPRRSASEERPAGCCCSRGTPGNESSESRMKPEPRLSDSSDMDGRKMGRMAGERGGGGSVDGAREEDVRGGGDWNESRGIGSSCGKGEMAPI